MQVKCLKNLLSNVSYGLNNSTQCYYIDVAQFIFDISVMYSRETFVCTRKEILFICCHSSGESVCDVGGIIKAAM